MKFGVLQFFSWPERRVPLATVYDRAIDRVKIMDGAGYDAVWLAEHHFSTYSVCPSVHIMGMHLAHLTENVRIGTAVSLAAFYHPLRLAEELALLDNLSGGRVNAGFGRGFDRTEMSAFGVEMDESYDRFRENVDIVLQAWQTERLTYHGKYHSYEDIEVLPKPAQDPMPTWVAASSPAAVEWAAQQGHAILMDPHSSHAEIASKYAVFKETLRCRGLTNDRPTPMARLLAIAATDAEAEAIARQGAEWTVGSYAGPKKGGPPSDLEPGELVERYVNDVIIHGSPAKVADQLKELEETMPLDYLLASILSHETFIRLTDEVIPRMAS
jgi:alkanesulfonate monooxygenase SsuD/methylene tetrahydromethanopterin reductase-like flavin-dependent oxidoreductase (luciferase family)